MTAKYKIIDDTRDVDGFKVYRIQALRDIGDVLAGELGGYVASGNSLSQDGEAWVYADSVIMGNAQVTHNAKVKDRSIIRGNAIVSGDAQVIHSKVQDAATVRGQAILKHVIVGGPEVVQGQELIEGLLEGDEFEEFGYGTPDISQVQDIVIPVTQPDYSDTSGSSYDEFKPIDEQDFTNLVTLDTPQLSNEEFDDLGKLDGDDVYEDEYEDVYEDLDLSDRDEPDTKRKVAQSKRTTKDTRKLGEDDTTSSKKFIVIIGVIVLVAVTIIGFILANIFGGAKDVEVPEEVVSQEVVTSTINEADTSVIDEPEPINFGRLSQTYLEPPLEGMDFSQYESEITGRLMVVGEEFTQEDVSKFDEYYLSSLSVVDEQFNAWLETLNESQGSKAQDWYERGVEIFKNDIQDITERLELYIQNVSGSVIEEELVQIIYDIEQVLISFKEDITQHIPDELLQEIEAKQAEEVRALEEAKSILESAQLESNQDEQGSLTLESDEGDE